MFKSKLLVTIMVIALYFQGINAQVSHIVISALYGGGSNSGAIFSNDFVELFNPTSSPDTLTNWSVQYASSASASWQKQVLTTIIPAGSYYLIQFNGGTGIGAALPIADVIGTINLNATGGKVALVNTSTSLAGDDVTGVSTVDFVGYGTTATGYETLPAPAPSSKKCLVRVNGGCTDVNNNSTDFSTSTVYTPHNSLSQASICVNLPVVLKSFTAILKNNEVELNWQTSDELNFSHFIIEKLVDGNDFSNVATVYSNNTVSGSNYSYIDTKTEVGNQFYRLKMVDNNGSFTYSSTVKFEKKVIDDKNISVLINPAINTLVIQHPVACIGAKILIIGIDGRTLISKKVTTGTCITDLEISNLKNTEYLVSYQENGISMVKIFLKK